MQFTSPEFLLLLPVLIWFWRGVRRTPGHRSPRRVVRCAVGACLVLALSGLQVRSGDAPSTVMFLLDRSASMAGVQQESLREINSLAAPMRAEDRVALLVFGANAAIERPLSSQLNASNVAAAISITGTNVEAALRLARAMLPTAGSRRVVLMSDGNETSGDAAAESLHYASAGLPIDVVVLTEGALSAPIDVMRVSAPQTARVGEPFVISVIARGVPATRGTISLTGLGGDSWSESVTLGSDGLAAATFSSRAEDAGIRVYEATVQAERSTDFDRAPRRLGAVVSVAGETRILHVGANPSVLGPALTRHGFRLHYITTESFPRSAGALDRYDGIVFDDVAANRIDAAQAAALSSHVQHQGGGLLFLGGRNSLEAGLLADNPIGDLLPLDVRPRSGQRAPSLGLVVAFDKSGSMDDRVDGVPRIEFARQAVRRLFDAVPASDAVGVIAFDSSPQAVAPLQVGRDRATLIRNLAAVQPSGSTAIAPAIELAGHWLGSISPALSRRHVLLVSDGRTSVADAARLRTVLERGGFELSVVALGADADRRLLESLARSTGGRAFFPKDIRELPAIVAREAARVSGGRVFDAPFVPIARAHPVVAGLEALLFPQLGGYVVGVAKPSAEVPLQSALNDPILATWRNGLGRVAVYTAELHGAWSLPLRSWQGFEVLFAQTMRWASRRVRDDTLYASFDEDDSGLRLIVEAQRSDGTLLNELDSRAEVRTPRGETMTVALNATAPGRYEAHIDGADPGAYVVAISARRADGFENRIVRGIYWSADREYRATGPNLALLARLAEVSGGRVLGAAESPFSAPRPRALEDAWPWLTGAALMLFLAEVLLPGRPEILARFQRRRAHSEHPEEAAA